MLSKKQGSKYICLSGMAFEVKAELDKLRKQYEKPRVKMVEELVEDGVLTKKSVIRAMKTVPRELFLAKEDAPYAYRDTPLRIAAGQTISAPHMNAMMCQMMELKESDKVLEVGTGSGYHAALCAEIVAPEGAKNPGHVHTVEIHKVLSDGARESMKKAGYDTRVTCIHSDGGFGYEKQAPYDKILVTCASPNDIPKSLMNQLADGGIMVIPAGSEHGLQYLYIMKKKGDKIESTRSSAVRFVPLTGKCGFK